MRFSVRNINVLLLASTFLNVQSFLQVPAATRNGFVASVNSQHIISSSTPLHQSTPFIQKKKALIRVFMSKGEEDRNQNDVLDFVKADDGEALQALFEKQCDQDGLMTKKSLVSIPMIADLLAVGDLLQEELDDIWEAAPKFPDLESTATQRIDVDSFIEIYRDIDDIFEDSDDDDGDAATGVVKETNEGKGAKTQNKSTDDGSEEDSKTQAADGGGGDQELTMAFYAICNKGGTVSKEDLLNWSEIQELLEDNMLDEKEFNSMWDKTVKGQTMSTDQLDLKSFLAFNAELDELFVFDDDEDVESKDTVGSKEEKPFQLFYGDDLPVGVVFSELADDDFLIGMEELKKWGDLVDMLAEGDLLPIELQNMFEQIPKAPGTKDKINEEGFENLYEAIDALFEDEGDDDVEEVEEEKKSVKSDLYEVISYLGEDEEKMACGLDSTESEVQQILNMVAELESEPSNLVLSTGGDVAATDVAGNWELLYTTSSTMKFNKGLSGLVPPNGQFGGLRQTLKASKYLADIEYIEQINAGPASFEVRVTGDWELRNSVSLFTGSRSVALSVEPDKVKYGLTSQRADHWKSLGPLNLLDIAYLDDDTRIMRGTTSTDSIFIFKKIN